MVKKVEQKQKRRIIMRVALFRDLYKHYETVETIKSKLHNYYIKKNQHGFYIVTEPRSFWKLLTQKTNDRIGKSLQHPEFLDNKYHKHIEDAKEYIKYHTRLKESIKDLKKTIKHKY